jgi:hypothetical protein
MPNGLQMGERSLRFIRSIPANGARNVSPSIRTITLIFNRNVTADSVWDNNRRQILVFEGSRRLVRGRDFRIVRSRDFDDRRKIFIKPIGRLAANTRITIVILPGLRAVNGRRLGRRVVIRFRTGRRGMVEE